MTEKTKTPITPQTETQKERERQLQETFERWARTRARKNRQGECRMYGVFSNSK